MTSQDVAEVQLHSDDIDRIVGVRLLGGLGDEFEELAAWPVGQEERGLKAEYFSDKNFKEKIYEHTDNNVGLNFRHTREASNGHVPGNHFSARWTGLLVPERSGAYKLHLSADDRGKLWFDGKPLLAARNARETDTAEVELEAGRPYEIRIEMVENAGRARLQFLWESEALGIERERVPARVMIPEKGERATRRDDLIVQADSGHSGHGIADIRRHLLRSGGVTYYQRDTRLDRQDTPWHGRDGWYSARMAGKLYTPRSRVLELKMTQGQSRYNRQFAHILVNGEAVFSGRVQNRDRQRTYRVALEKGVHELEVLTTDYGRNGAVDLSYRTDEGTFEPLPASWFSVKQHPRARRARDAQGRDRDGGGPHRRPHERAPAAARAAVGLRRVHRQPALGQRDPRDRSGPRPCDPRRGGLPRRARQRHARGRPPATRSLSPTRTPSA